MKLCSWFYLPMDDAKSAPKRRKAIDLLQRTGVDIALCVWGNEQIVANGAAIERLSDELARKEIELHVGISPLSAPQGTPRKRLYQYEVKGKRSYGHLCPSWPENRDRVVADVERICRSASFLGLHLDFIRYLHSAGAPWKLEWEAGREWIDTYQWCQCEACRAARAKWLSRPEFTTYDRFHPSVIFKEFEFRKRNVEDVFRRIREETNRHGRVLSIAQRVQYLNRALTEGQDWMEWAEQGLFDFTCPMNYTTCTETFRKRMEENRPRLAHRGSVKVYEGVSRRSSAGESTIQTVLEQMSAALEFGADGACLFHLGVLKPGEHDKIRRWKRSAC